MAASQKVLRTGKIGGFLIAKDNHDVVSPGARFHFADRPLSRLGGTSRRKSAGRSCFKPGSNSMAPMAAVLPTLKICTMPVRTPDSLTIRVTASVRSCISPALCVCSVISCWKTMRHHSTTAGSGHVRPGGLQTRQQQSYHLPRKLPARTTLYLEEIVTPDAAMNG